MCAQVVAIWCVDYGEAMGGAGALTRYTGGACNRKLQELAMMDTRLETNKQNAMAFYDLMFNQYRPHEAMEQYVGEVYIQHNPHVANGKEAFIASFERMDGGGVPRQARRLQARHRRG
jgi:hypothetical protein